jgi:DNA-binding LacI/PurR family transcriptional regulator
MGKDMQKLTYKKIGELCGVSGNVVSAIISPSSGGSVRFSEGTRRRVLAVAKRHNFRPNRTWINATRQRHGCIGLLIRNVYDLHHDAYVAIVREAKKSGLTVVIDTYEEGTGLPLFLREDVVDGMLVFRDYGDGVRNLMEELRIPTVHINANVDEKASVNFDYAGSMDLLADYLSGKGKASAGLLLASRDFRREVREESFRKACRRRGVAVNIVPTGESDVRSQMDLSFLQEWLLSFMLEHPDTDAFVLDHHRIIPQLYKALSDIDRKVPKDVAVTCLDDRNEVCRSLVPSVTVLAFKNGETPEGVGTRMLCDIIGGKEDVEPVLIEYEILERGSS